MLSNAESLLTDHGIGINESGMVPGGTVTANWVGDSATIQTIPEPAAFAMIGVFSGGLFFIRRIFTI